MGNFLVGFLDFSFLRFREWLESTRGRMKYILESKENSCAPSDGKIFSGLPLCGVFFIAPQFFAPSAQFFYAPL